MARNLRKIQSQWAEAVKRGDVGERRVQEIAARDAGLPGIAQAMAKMSDAEAKDYASRTR